MSRNLARTDCSECPGGTEHILLEGPTRPVTAKEDPYHAEHEGLLIAEARCVLCHTLYFAWVDWPNSQHSYWHLKDRRYRNEDARFVDLSYRASFNDEPAPVDLPVYDVREIRSYSRAPAQPHTYLKYGTDEQRAAYYTRREATLAAKMSVADEMARVAHGADKENRNG